MTNNTGVVIIPQCCAVMINFVVAMVIDFVAMIAGHFVVVIEFVANKASSETCCSFLVDKTENLPKQPFSFEQLSWHEQFDRLFDQWHHVTRL